MKLRVTRADESKIKPAILQYNLMTEVPRRSCSSGSCDWVNDGVPIQGGYLIKRKRESLLDGQAHLVTERFTFLCGRIAVEKEQQRK